MFETASRRNLQVVRNRHFAACTKYGRPFITVWRKGRCASIELDMFTTKWNLDEAAQDAIATLLEKQSEPNARIVCGGITCSTNRIVADLAELVATEIYHIAERAMKSEPFVSRFKYDN